MVSVKCLAAQRIIYGKHMAGLGLCTDKNGDFEDTVWSSTPRNRNRDTVIGGQGKRDIVNYVPPGPADPDVCSPQAYRHFRRQVRSRR